MIVSKKSTTLSLMHSSNHSKTLRHTNMYSSTVCVKGYKKEKKEKKARNRKVSKVLLMSLNTERYLRSKFVKKDDH